MADQGIQIRVVDRMLESMREDGPRPLARNLELFGGEYGDPKSITVDDLLHEVCSKDPNNIFKLEFHRALIHWDYVSNSSWSKKTQPNTSDRRNIVYSCLGLSASDGKRLDVAAPHAVEERPTVIAKEHKAWYTNALQQGGFYWPAYRKYLAMKSWDDSALETLSESTKEVVERLADPSQTAAFQAKGLVVGYVQSGKTANFTGVIARAADAGYRLFIVLTGQTELLRRQTQRRLDKEMIGRELVDDEYERDRDFSQFISHGERPSKIGYFDWHRLTRFAYDYQSLKAGIESLEFEKHNNALPFYEMENLLHAKARLIVIKKNKLIMAKVIKDLKRIRGRLDDVPAMIIDDESDQASLNVKPRGEPHSAINAKIVELLKILPRAQYVGYTATPFANVFVDPTDSEDLFPKDFILSLPRPLGYMGVRAFYDFDDVGPEDPRSNKRAFVRDVIGDDSNVSNLPKALDSFILAGALKLYRINRKIKMASPHHTMLVHHASAKAKHREKLLEIQTFLNQSDYRSGDALRRLEKLYKADFSLVTAVKGRNMPNPRDFRSLAPFIGQCLTQLNVGGPAVLMVNSEEDAETPDFDSGPVWKILVGGNKLSRGYTIEGLTVSYYRRYARTSDTLMQMGRWFGFRGGYSDLVRLFIGTDEQTTKSGGRIDLYDAFGAVCRDEEVFRSQLARYASMKEPRILPIQVPPLVPSHMLMPAAKNKMFNAKIRFENFSAESSESTIAPTDPTAIKHNWNKFSDLLASVKLEKRDVAFAAGDESYKFYVLSGLLDKNRVVSFLRQYRWNENRTPLQRVIEFLEGTGERDPSIDRWLFLAPQQVSAEGSIQFAGNQFSVFRRKRLEGGRISIYSEPRHKLLAEFASLKKRKDDTKPPIKNLSKSGQELYAPHQAVFLYYTVKTTENDKRSFPAFVLLYPENKIKTPIQFGVEDPTRPDAVIVAAQKKRS